LLADYENSGPMTSCRFAGIILAISGPDSDKRSEPAPDMQQMRVAVRNKIQVGDTIDILTQNGSPAVYTIGGIKTIAGEELQTAQAGMEVLLRCGPLHHVSPDDIVRTMAPQPPGACGKHNG